MHLFERQDLGWLKEMLSKAWSKGLKQLLGLSINADGTQSTQLMNGRPMTVVQSIKQIFSTDLVTNPAAGGRLLQIVESINEQERRSENMFKFLVNMFKEKRPDLLEGINVENIKEEDVAKIFASLLSEVMGHKKTAEEAKESAKKLAEDKQNVAEKAKETELEEAIKLATKAVEELELKENDLDKVLKNESSLKKIISLFEAKKFPLAVALIQKFFQASIKAPAKKTDPAKEGKDTKALEARIAQLEKEGKETICKNTLNTFLASSKLPAAIQEKVREQFSGSVFKESVLLHVIKSEKKALAKLTESGDIIDLGDVGEAEITLRRSGNERLQADVDLTFGYDPSEAEKADYEGAKAFTSLREMYVAITGDVEVNGKVSQGRLKEAATSGSFSYMLGYSINRRMLKEYKALPELWKNIASTVPIKDFKMQELIRWGGFGVLPEVIAARTTQGTATDTATPTYPELGFPLDSEQTYALATKGGLVTVTRRSIINDDLRQLVKVPQKLARAANRTLNQFVFDLMLGYTSSGINAATKWPNGLGTANSSALYATLHNNYITTALGFTALDTLLRMMYHQAEEGYTTNTTDNTINSSTTTINVTADAGQFIKAGDMIRIDAEYMMVNVVATDALTVTRAILGTTAASHDKSGTYPVVHKITSILGLSDVTAWVPRTLKGTLETLINSTLHPENAENPVNTLKGMAKIMVSPYLRGDENNYYLSAGKAEIDLIEVGFLGGKEKPEILVQDQPTVGNVFVYDTIRYKVRHEYGGVVPDYKAFAAGIVSGIS